MQLLYGIVMLIATALPAVTATGINCQGAFGCGVEGHGNEAATLVGYINNISLTRWYNNGEQIACTINGICAFLQNTGGAPGQNIKGLAHFIPEHGCGVCGSVPYFYPAINDVSQGMLTFNFVTKKCGTGLC